MRSGKLKTEYFVPVKGNQYSITFDDGPSKDTPAILDILEKSGSKSTHFLVSSNIRKRPGFAAAITKAGHEVGIHSVTHNRGQPDMTADEALYMFDEAKKLIEDVCQVTPKLYRPTYGRTYPSVQEACRLNRMTLCGWSGHIRDWADGASGTKASWMVHQACPGTVFLVHDGAIVAPSILAGALPKLKSLHSVTMSDLIDAKDRPIIEEIGGATMLGARVMFTSGKPEVSIAAFWDVDSFEASFGVDVVAMSGDRKLLLLEKSPLLPSRMHSWKANYKFLVPPDRLSLPISFVASSKDKMSVISAYLPGIGSGRVIRQPVFKIPRAPSIMPQPYPPRFSIYVPSPIGMPARPPQKIT